MFLLDVLMTYSVRRALDEASKPNRQIQIFLSFKLMLRSAHPSFPSLTLLLHHLACMAGVWKQERTERARQTREGRGSLSPGVSPRTRNSLPGRRSQGLVTRSCRNAWRIPKKRLRGRLLRVPFFLTPITSKRLLCSGYTSFYLQTAANNTR